MEGRSLDEMEGPDFGGWEGSSYNNAEDFSDYGSGWEEDLYRNGGCSSPRLLPGCSWSPCAQEGRQFFSNSMMQAYVAMRGPAFSFGPNGDPLSDWISARRHLGVPSPAPENDITKMFLNISRSIDESTLPGDSPRDALFQMKRPEDFGHIQPSVDMDLSVHELTQSCADFEFDSDEDDDEAPAPTGRISPCTFLAWTKGARRWDEEPTWRVSTEGNQRMRPPTPESPRTPRSAASLSWYWDSISQHDEVEGDGLSPQYQPPTSPSIIFTPPGVPIHMEHSMWASNTFHAKFSRMDPMAALQFRAIEYGDPGLGVKPASENEFYTASEVHEACSSIPVAKMTMDSDLPMKPIGASATDLHDRNHEHGENDKVVIPNPTALAKDISTAWQNLNATIAGRKALEDDAEQKVKPRIEKLHHETDLLSNYLIPRLKFLRLQAEKERQNMQAEQERKEQDVLRLRQLEANKKVVTEEMKKAARRDRIKAHVATQVRDLVAQQERETTALNNVSKNREALVGWMRDLEARISRTCEEVGLKDFEDVVDEIGRLEENHDDGSMFLDSISSTTNDSAGAAAAHQEQLVTSQDDSYDTSYPDTVIFSPDNKDKYSAASIVRMVRPPDYGEYDSQGFWNSPQKKSGEHDEYDAQGFWKDPNNTTAIHNEDSEKDYNRSNEDADREKSSQVTVKQSHFPIIEGNRKGNEHRVVRVTIQPTDYHRHNGAQSQREKDGQLTIPRIESNTPSTLVAIRTPTSPPLPPSTPQPNPLITITAPSSSTPFFSPQPYYPPPFTRDNYNIHNLLHGGPVSESNLPPPAWRLIAALSDDEDQNEYDYYSAEAGLGVSIQPALPPPAPPGMAVAITLDSQTGKPYYCLVPEEVFSQSPLAM